MITPYAIGNQAINQPPPINSSSTIEKTKLQPSTSRNLPDVLSTTAIPSTSSSALSSQQKSTIPKPQTNVQKIAQSFASNPNFHITRSPTTNRKIPQYTIPSKLAASCSSKPDPTASSNSDSDSDRSQSHSDHSGGSNITYKIDEIEYADA